MKSTLLTAALAGALFAAGAATASAKNFNFHYYGQDATQAYNSNVIAGAAPDFYSTFIRGVRCHYEYRVQYGQRIKFQVCE